MLQIYQNFDIIYLERSLVNFIGKNLRLIEIIFA